MAAADLRMGSLVNMQNSREDMARVKKEREITKQGAAVVRMGGDKKLPTYLAEALSVPRAEFALGVQRSLAQLEAFANVDFKEGRSLGPVCLSHFVPFATGERADAEEERKKRRDRSQRQVRFVEERKEVRLLLAV